jgi:hypothetical protein
MSDYNDAANRLHHLSLRYVGAFAEIAKGQKVGLLPNGTPGLKEMRDLIDLILFARAEINGLTKILFDRGLVTGEQLAEIMTEQYQHITKEKAQWLGVVVTDAGLTFSTGPEKN